MKIVVGSAVYFQAKIYNMKVVPPAPPALFNPDGGVKITLLDPNGSTILSLTAMTNIGTGIYDKTYATLTNDVIGRWTVRYQAQDGDAVTITQDMHAFELVAS